MFERMLAIRYIREQKRHSVLTVCSIMIAVALMTLLFTALSTVMGIWRDKAMEEMPYHVKAMRLTQEEFDLLAACPEFSKCERVVESNYTLSAELLLRRYHEDIVQYLNSVVGEKRFGDGMWFPRDLEFNYELLTCDSMDFNGRMNFLQIVTTFYVFLVFLLISLRLVIDTAFEVSAKERERQFGVLQSIGATPGQVARVITFEGLLLSVAGIPLGILLGLGLSVAAFQAVMTSGISEVYCTPEQAGRIMHLHISPLFLTLGAMTGLVWVMLSAYATGMRILKMSPIEAISGKNAKVKKVRRHSLFGLLFGWQGRLAARNNRRQPKRFIITVLSLTLSIMLFSSFSVVLDAVQNSVLESQKSLGLVYDFELMMEFDREEPLSYHKAYDAICDSGYFDVVDFELTHVFTSDKEVTEEAENYSGLVMYLSPETYANFFEGEPPVPYETLSAGERYLLCAPIGVSEQGSAYRLRGEPEITTCTRYKRKLTEEAYEAMSAEEREKVNDATVYDQNTGEERVLYHYVSDYDIVNVPVCGFGRQRREEWMQDVESQDNFIYLIGTLDQFDTGEYDTFIPGVFEENYQTIAVNLRDPEQYNAAMQWIEDAGNVHMSLNLFGNRKEMRTVLAALRIGCGFLTVLIGLIAVVNLVNILSTSLLNRRQELAAMQCLGMTRGQLYGMTVMECLQYVLSAAVGALLLSEGLIFATDLMLHLSALLEPEKHIIQYSAPVPMILLASCAAFFAALAASLLPLQAMQRVPLTDQLRSVE